MTTSEKIDFLYSKFVSPNQAQTSVFNSQIWSQGNEIPQSLPVFDSNNEYIGPSGDAILKKHEYVQMTKVSGSLDAFSSTIVYDIVSYENGFDSTYEYKFYTKASNGNYIEIPFGESGYFFDHDTGILFFPDAKSYLYNPSSLYVSFIKYVGEKGIDGSSQFSGYPQPGEVGPTGPIGPTGETGRVDPFSIRYKGTWSSSTQYSKWNLVKYNGMFFISTIDSNTYYPTNGAYWQPFGIPQLSAGFDHPNDAYYVSPSFSTGGGRFNDIESLFSEINSQASIDVTAIIYPGEYQINNNIPVRPGVNINFIFYGRVTVSFREDNLTIGFSQGSKIEFRGNDFEFTNGRMLLICSNLSVVGGKLAKVNLITTNLSDTARFMAVNTQIESLTNYASFASLRGTNVVEQIIVDELSVTHIDGCMMQAGQTANEKIRIISAIDSGVPPGFGFEHPALMIKNSRVLSNGPVLYSTIAPLHGFQIGILSSSLYVTDGLTDFLDFTNQFDAFVFSTVVNTGYDDTKLQILNINGGFQTIDAIFED